jgi:DNA-directed RNA polymerase subunit RPC12/RpoP
MAEYVTCPSCGSKVLTADSYIGQQVRCFGCGSRFVASPDPAEPNQQSKPRSPPVPRSVDEPMPAPPRLAGGEQADEDWPFCPGCGRAVAWEDAACPHCGEEFEEDDRPPVRPLHLEVLQPIRRDGEPHRGRLLFTLSAVSCLAGLLSVCTCGLLGVISVPLGATVWVMASRDLRHMEDGSVDPGGRSLTRHARSAAIAGVAFGVLFGGVYFLIWQTH